MTILQCWKLKKVSFLGKIINRKLFLEKKLDNLEYFGVEWRPLNYLNLNKEQSEKIVEVLEALEELDDVQNVYVNVNLGNTQSWKS